MGSQIIEKGGKRLKGGPRDNEGCSSTTGVPALGTGLIARKRKREEKKTKKVTAARQKPRTPNVNGEKAAERE